MPTMRILSLNVGQPRELTWKDKTVRTAFIKEAVTSPLRAGRLGLEGDAQADLKVHGGPDSAVYLFPHEHYPFWRDALSVDELPWGALGENGTVTGMLESEVRLGDRFAVGSAELQITHPRLPCSTLNLRYGKSDLVELCIESGYCGFYCSVPREGRINPGDEVQLLERDPQAPTIEEFFRAATTSPPDPEVMSRALRITALPEKWRTKFHSRLAQKKGR